MNRRDLAKAVAAQTGVDPKVVAQVIEGTTEVITTAVSKGEPVLLTGFAKFSKVKRAARMGRNPATGEAIKIKAKTAAKITPLKGYKDAVLNPKLAPTLEKGVLAADGSLGPAAAPAKKAPAKKTAAKKATKKKAGAKKAGSRSR